MAQSDLNHALQLIRSRNITLTPQRYALLEYLYTRSSYTTVKDICDALVARYPHINATSVYSSLRVFKRLGLVRELAVVDTSPRYEAAIG